MTVRAMWLFLTVLLVSLQCVIVICLDHTHFLKRACSYDTVYMFSLTEKQQHLTKCSRYVVFLNKQLISMYFTSIVSRFNYHLPAKITVNLLPVLITLSRRLKQDTLH